MEHVRWDLKVSDLDLGTIVASMHGHEVASGILKNWKVESFFRISQKVFEAMNAELPTAGQLVQNRYALLIETDIPTYHNDCAAVVIYPYDGQYYCATLTTPV